MKQATLQAVICSADKVPSLVEIAARHPCLAVVIVMPPQPFEAKAPAVRAAQVPQPASLRILTLADAEQLGAQTAAAFKHTVPAPDDFCTFCYTSGTENEERVGRIGPA